MLETGHDEYAFLDPPALRDEVISLLEPLAFQHRVQKQPADGARPLENSVVDADVVEGTNAVEIQNDVIGAGRELDPLMLLVVGDPEVDQDFEKFLSFAHRRQFIIVVFGAGVQQNE